MLETTFIAYVLFFLCFCCTFSEILLTVQTASLSVKKSACSFLISGDKLK